MEHIFGTFFSDLAKTKTFSFVWQLKFLLFLVRCLFVTLRREGNTKEVFRQAKILEKKPEEKKKVYIDYYMLRAWYRFYPRVFSTTIISWVRRDESSLKSFDVQISVLPRATFLDSNGNNIVARNFARFATIDVKPDTSPLETEPVALDNN